MALDGFMGGGGGYSLSTSEALGFNTGATDIKTGATFNFSKPASATGIDLSGSVGWAILAAGVVVLALVVKRKKGA